LAECTSFRALPHCIGNGSLYEFQKPSMAAYVLWLNETDVCAFPPVDWSAIYPWEPPAAAPALEACCG